MAQSSVRRPIAVPDEISLSKVRLTLLVDSLISKGKQGVKNGSLDIQLTKAGMAFTATITSNKGETTRWEYKVRKFPSEIFDTQSTWKVENGKVIFELVKRESMSWESMMRRGLDQADSSDED